MERPFQFGRGWSLEKLDLELLGPRYFPLIGYADAWSPSTPSEIVGSPIFLGKKSPEEVDRMRAQLKGAIVMTDPVMTNFVRKDRPQPSDPDYAPNSAAYATSVGQRPGGPGSRPHPRPANRPVRPRIRRRRNPETQPRRARYRFRLRPRPRTGRRPPHPPQRRAGFNLLAQMLEQNITIKLKVNVQTKFYDNDNGNTYNVIAELPGSDPAVSDEVVMIGGHLDSWHTGVGATDNADGATTVIEAMRILKAIGAKPRRTIRVALWAGEEQGMLGSKAWVQQNLLGDSNTEARRKMDVYFNIDNGTGPIYGWYLQNSRSRPLPSSDAWLEPLKSFGGKRAISLNPSDPPITSASSKPASLVSTPFRITPATTSAPTTPTWTP